MTPFPLPIIGLSGGIGSGKSFVADLFGEQGCCVIHADEQVHRAYADPRVRETLMQWWGAEVLLPDGLVNRALIGRRVFSDENQLRRLEALLHPWVARDRERIMSTARTDPAVRAVVWDIPLLFETGLYHRCNRLVFVESPLEMRIERVTRTRGWNRDEINRREKMQWPLDKKRKLSDDVVVNTADAAACRSQVREILSRILVN